MSQNDLVCWSYIGSSLEGSPIQERADPSSPFSLTSPPHDMADSPDSEPLAETVKRIFDTGFSLTPLIKEELRCKIQSRRLHEGKDELQITYSTSENEQLTPIDMHKRVQRRKRNNLAARQYRRRLRDCQDRVIDEYCAVEQSNMNLQQEISQLLEERDTLENILKTHLSQCSKSSHKRRCSVVPKRQDVAKFEDGTMGATHSNSREIYTDIVSSKILRTASNFVGVGSYSSSDTLQYHCPATNCHFVYPDQAELEALFACCS